MLNKYFRSLSLGGEKLRHIKDIFLHEHQLGRCHPCGLLTRTGCSHPGKSTLSSQKSHTCMRWLHTLFKTGGFGQQFVVNWTFVKVARRLVYSFFFFLSFSFLFYIQIQIRDNWSRWYDELVLAETRMLFLVNVCIYVCWVALRGPGRRMKV